MTPGTTQPLVTNPTSLTLVTSPGTRATCPIIRLRWTQISFWFGPSPMSIIPIFKWKLVSIHRFGLSTTSWVNTTSFMPTSTTFRSLKKRCLSSFDFICKYENDHDDVMISLIFIFTNFNSGSVPWCQEEPNLLPPFRRNPGLVF